MKKEEEMYNIDMQEGRNRRVMTTRRASSISEIIRTALKIADNFNTVFNLSSIRIEKSAD